MADWNPALYARFADERARPIADLLTRIDFDTPLKSVDLEAPMRIVDLGCGAGASTNPLLERWPDADVLGIDTSAAMLEKARAAVPGARFELADVATWGPATPVDLLFSNATLQWVPDHTALLPRLMGHLVPGGILAVQIPDNLDEPSHALMREVAAEPPFAELLRDAAGARTALLSLENLYDALAPLASRVEIWRTAYVHPLDGPEKIVEMISSTGLRPFLDPLPADLRAVYLTRYTAKIAEAYPRCTDGRVLLRFPRLFWIAVKR